MRRFLSLAGLLASLCFTSAAVAEGWLPGFGVPGVRGYITDVFAWNDLLVVTGGLYPNANATVTTAAMAWDGRAWHDLGLHGGVGNAAGTFEGQLVVGGYFPGFPEPDSVSRIAILNGTTWNTLGPGLNDRVYKLGSYRGQLVAAGVFTAAGNDSIRGIAAWDGLQWTSLGEGIPGLGYWNIFYGYYPSIASLIEFDDKLYVGGIFQQAGTDSIWGSAVWDGASWSPMDSSVRAGITDMVQSGGAFYAVGTFYDPATEAYWETGTWRDGKWVRLGDPRYFDMLEAVAVHEGSIYVGQSTGDVGAANCFADNLYRLNGSSWEGVACTDGFSIGEIRSWNGRLVIASGFDEIDDRVVRGIAAFDGARWSAFGQGLEFVENVWGDRRPVRIDVVAATSLGIVAGGLFSHAGGVVVNNIATWNGIAWESHLSGLLGSVHAVTEVGGLLIAGGDFGSAGEGYVAAWNDGYWDTIGDGVSGPVRALLPQGNDLIAGGSFGWAGGMRVNGVAAWNGTQWTPMGEGFNDEVVALAEYRGFPVAGGHFTASAGTVTRHVAVFDGGSWRSLGTGTDGPLLTAVEYGDLLAVGGDFSFAGDVPAANVAAWDGTQWMALGAGTDGPVRSLAVTGGVLVAGGSFTRAGEEGVEHVAMWDGVAWHGLDQGTDGTVHAVCALADSGFALGGAFTRAGDVASSGIAVWPGALTSARREAVIAPLLASPNPFSSVTTISLRLQEPQNVTVVICDVQGRAIAHLWQGGLPSGVHDIVWDGRTQVLSPAPAGIYFARILGDDTHFSRKLVKLSR